jgi:hypothetical protein
VKRTIEVLNELEKEGVLSRYAIGGAMGAIFTLSRSLPSTSTSLSFCR